MSLETVIHIADLVATNPPPNDPKSQGDDHLRNIKKALLNDLNGFTGAILCTGADGGAANAYTVTPSTALVAYGLRMLVTFSPIATNTGASTMNISGLGAKALKSLSGADLVLNDLVLGNIYAAYYNGTEFRLLSVTKNYIDQLAFGTVLPAQAGNGGKFLRTNGTVASWEYPGITTINALVTANATLVGSDLYVPVQMATLGQSVTVPAANTLVTGGPRYIIDNSKGAFSFAIRDSNGAMLTAVAPGGQALVTLQDNSTAAGVWSATGSGLEPGLITIDQTLSGTYLSTVLAPFVALDANTSLHFAALTSGFAAFVIDNTGKTVGTPVTVSAAAGDVPVAAFRISATQAIVFYGGNNNAVQMAVVLTLTGTAIAVGTAATLTFTSIPPWSGENWMGAPKIVQLTATLYSATLSNTTPTTVAVAISVSGATVTIGATAQIAAVNAANSQALYALTASTALVVYGPGAPSAAVVSVAGTTCTVGAVVASGLSSPSGTAVSCLLSATKAIVSTATAANAQAQAITITGTVVAFGAVLTMDAAVAADLTYTAAGATRYNPHLFPVGANAALLWYSQSTGSMASIACILSESAGTLTKGTTLFGSISSAVPSNSGYGTMAAPGTTEFIGIMQHGAPNGWRKVAVPHAIRGTAITYGAGQPLTELSPVQEVSAYPTARLTQGDYVVVGANSIGLPVLRSNGAQLAKRGVISLPNLGGPSAYPLAAVAANRLALVAATAGTTASAAVQQLRILNIEVAA